MILTYSLMLVFAQSYLRKQHKIDKSEFVEDYVHAMHWKPVSIITPVYNEEAGVIDSIHSLLNLRYPQSEIIIVNDGSTDRTLQLVIEQFRMQQVDKRYAEQLPTQEVKAIYRSEIHPHLLVIDKENGGKADALNAGINAARYPYFCSIDGDSILEEQSLLHVMKPIMTSNDEVIATGGNVRIANGLNISLGAVQKQGLSNNPLVVMQVVEYLRAFLMGRIAFSKFNLVLIISGAFSVFSKRWVIEAGGYQTQTIGEDMELVVRLQRLIKEKKANKRIAFVPEPVCWTEAPQDLGTLRRQRMRWQQGLLESLWRHRKMTFNPKYKGIGLIAVPYFMLVEGLGTLVELGGYIYVIIAFFMGGIYYEFALLLMLLFVLHGTVFSMASILLEAWSMNSYPRISDVWRLMLMSLTEVFWYKPMNLLWRCEGFVKFLMKNKDWGQMKRAGLSKKGTSG